jgi:hypothetical protein
MKNWIDRQYRFIMLVFMLLELALLAFLVKLEWKH